MASQFLAYIGEPKDSSKKCMELVRESEEVPGYKVSTQKSIVFEYMNQAMTEKGLTTSVSFILAKKKV